MLFIGFSLVLKFYVSISCWGFFCLVFIHSVFCVLVLFVQFTYFDVLYFPIVGAALDFLHL